MTIILKSFTIMLETINIGGLIMIVNDNQEETLKGQLYTMSPLFSNIEMMEKVQTIFMAEYFPDGAICDFFRTIDINLLTDEQLKQLIDVTPFALDLIPTYLKYNGDILNYAYENYGETDGIISDLTSDDYDDWQALMDYRAILDSENVYPEAYHESESKKVMVKSKF